MYEGAVDLSAWSAAVDLLSDALHAGGGGQFHMFDSTHQPMIYSCMPQWISRDAEATYNARFAASDPRRQLGESRSPGEWVYDQEHFDERYVERSEVYELLIRHCSRGAAVPC
jgi:hypothetical protein